MSAPIRKVVPRTRVRLTHYPKPIRFVKNFERFIIIRGTEMAKMLGVPKSMVYRWCRRDGMPHRAKGKVFTFNMQEVQQWLIEDIRFPREPTEAEKQQEQEDFLQLIITKVGHHEER